MKNMNIQEGQDKPITEGGIEYLPAGDILRGDDDKANAYWNSFLPIFFDRMNFLSRKAMYDSVKDEGLTSAHAYYLIALNLRDGQTLMELTRFLDDDYGNSNRVIKTLREKGFICDDRKTPKSKKFSIYLTGEGKALADKVMHDTQECMNGFLKGVPESNIKNLRQTLVMILYNIDPKFEAYVDHPFTNPFYTYLGIWWPDNDREIALHNVPCSSYKKEPPSSGEGDRKTEGTSQK